MVDASVSKGSVRVYEDDGATTGYLEGKLAWTTAAYVVDGSSLTFTVSSEVQQSSLPTPALLPPSPSPSLSSPLFQPLSD